ncbi:MAG: MlaA family lipoprotein [Coraliomargarita sp.]
MLKLNSNYWALLLALLVPVTFACADDDVLSEEELFEEDLGESIDVKDPLEPVNRVIFKFNDFVYTNVADPVANTYEYVMPDTAQKGAGNFFHNLKYPVRLVGNLLQGKGKGALVETGRFAVNTTVGLFGVLDLASQVDGLEKPPKEDIGQALGSWGVSEGPYLVIPFLGPSNLRDFGGYLGDRCVNPWQEPFTVLDNWEWKLAYSVGDTVVSLPELLDMYEQMKGSAIDPYSSLKNGYTQYRRSEIAK